MLVDSQSPPVFCQMSSWIGMNELMNLFNRMIKHKLNTASSFCFINIVTFHFNSHSRTANNILFSLSFLQISRISSSKCVWYPVHPVSLRYVHRFYTYIASVTGTFGHLLYSRQIFRYCSSIVHSCRKRHFTTTQTSIKYCVLNIMEHLQNCTFI